MKDKNMELIESGLVCDNPNCDWEDKGIPGADYKDWINRPCPKCGENLLTEEDYHTAMQFRLAAELVSNLTPDQLAELAANVDLEKLKEHPMFKDAQGLENLKDSEDTLHVTVRTHNGIHFDKIEKSEGE